MLNIKVITIRDFHCILKRIGAILQNLTLKKVLSLIHTRHFGTKFSDKNIFESSHGFQ